MHFIGYVDPKTGKGIWEAVESKNALERRMNEICAAKRLDPDSLCVFEYPVRLDDTETKYVANPVRAKLFIRDGVASDMLADGPLDLEVVSIDKDYEDYEALERYDEELHNDPLLHETDFSSANFEDI